MTRKNRSRKEEAKDTKTGYCDVCNTEYMNIMVHRRSPQHLAFVRDSNFRSLDSLIQSGGDVSALLDKTSVNGERRSLRKLCNGDADHKHEATNGGDSPRANGLHDPKRRCRNSSVDATHNAEDRQYYKVIGVNTKLRSSGAFVSAQPDSPPPDCNGGSPSLVVKFRKVRRSELSVLSDEAEQFMFPRRASTSSSDDEKEEERPPTPERRRSLRPILKEEPDTVNSERRRSARPTALKEESSEDDSLPDNTNRRRKRPPPKRSRLTAIAPVPKLEVPEPAELSTPEVVQTPQEEAKERCLKWEDGRLKAAAAVEELQFCFESPPYNEPWYQCFQRQDQNKRLANNITMLFDLYAPRSRLLPYELGQLPPLKPNCCPLSNLAKKDDKGTRPPRSYGTRGNKKQKIRKRTAAAALVALEKHPRKSPREHASTLAILGGLLRNKEDDETPTTSEDTCSETASNIKVEVAPVSETQEQSERLRQFLSEVYDEAAEYEVPEEAMEGEVTVVTSLKPDVVNLIMECENCDIIRNEVKEEIAGRSSTPGRRGCKFKKKNRTGWPNKKKACAAKNGNSSVCKSETSTDTLDGIASADSASELDESTTTSTEERPIAPKRARLRSERRATETEGSAEEGGSEVSWGTAALQPVVRVAKIDSAMSRRLRSSGGPARRGAWATRSRAYRFR